jgi:hypothetical protein
MLDDTNLDTRMRRLKRDVCAMTDLAKGTLPDHPVEVKVIEGDLCGEINVFRGRTTHGSEARRGKVRVLG